MREDIQEQIRVAYRRMAAEAHHLPTAPGDGFGNITVPVEELDLEDEADKYAQRWAQEEDDRQLTLGSANQRTRPATSFTVEAGPLDVPGRGRRSRSCAAAHGALRAGVRLAERLIGRSTAPDRALRSTVPTRQGGDQAALR